MTPKKSRGGFFVPRSEDVRRLQLEIYRATTPKLEKKLYQEYFGSDVPDERGGRYYSDVDEYLEDRGITKTQALEIVESDHQSIVIGIPTYDNTDDHAGRIRYLEKVYQDIKILKSRYRDWPVELVVNVNGLDPRGNPQKLYLDRILEFQKYHLNEEAPITVIHMPLGGRLDGKRERLSGKSNAVNAISEYAKRQGATILGIMDDDIEFALGNISSNVEFLISKAWRLRSPLLTGSSSQSLPATSRWGKWLRSHKASGAHSVRGGSMFSFLFSFPPLPSVSISEDLYLRFYYADGLKSGKEMQWRIRCNPQATIYFRLADSFRDSLRQKYRFELCDKWALSILGDAKKHFRYPRYGYRLLVLYLAANIEREDVKKTMSNFRQSLLEFIFRNLLINHFISVDLWLRQLLDAPLFTTHWSSTVSPSTKREHREPTLDRETLVEVGNKNPYRWVLAQSGE